MVKQFDEAVFLMQPGDISEVVETVFGYHIILLEEVRPEAVKSFEDVHDEIAQQMIQQEVSEITKQRARKAYEDIIRSGSLDNYKEQAGADVIETEYFSKSSPTDSPVSDPKFLQVAFKLKKGELSSLVQTDAGFAILFVDDIKSPEVPELDAVKEKVVEDYKKTTSVELAKEAAGKLLIDSKERKSLENETMGDQVKHSEFITRSKPNEGGETPILVIQEAFKLSAKEFFPELPISQGEIFYVFQVVERSQGDELIDENQKKLVTEQLQLTAQNRIYENWISWMQSNADIWINEQILQ